MCVTMLKTHCYSGWTDPDERKCRDGRTWAMPGITNSFLWVCPNQHLVHPPVPGHQHHQHFCSWYQVCTCFFTSKPLVDYMYRNACYLDCRGYNTTKILLCYKYISVSVFILLRVIPNTFTNLSWNLYWTADMCKSCIYSSWLLGQSMVGEDQGSGGPMGTRPENQTGVAAMENSQLATSSAWRKPPSQLSSSSELAEL